MAKVQIGTAQAQNKVCPRRSVELGSYTLRGKLLRPFFLPNRYIGSPKFCLFFI